MRASTQYVNSFLTRIEFSCLLITFANNLDPDHDRYNVGPDLDPNFFNTLIAFLKDFFEKVDFESKKEGKDQKSIQSSTIPDPGYKWESDNVTIRHHKREPRGQPFPSR